MNNKKEKYLTILSLLVSIGVFSALTCKYISVKNIKPLVSEVALISFNGALNFDIYNSVNGEKNISKNALDKQLNAIDDITSDSKRLYLLLLIGNANVLAMQNTNEIAENYLVKQVVYNADVNKRGDIEDLDYYIVNKKGEFNKEKFDSYFNQIMKEYLALKPSKLNENRNFFNKEVIQDINESNKILDEKLENSLYTLKMTIDNRDNLKEIFSHKLNVVEFSSDPQKTWEKLGLTEKFGKEVPDYLMAFLGKNKVDKQVISNFINEYR